MQVRIAGFVALVALLTLAACGGGVTEPPIVTPEVCDNGIDDDKDGKIDCADTDCRLEASCEVKHENCQNGVDDNDDQLVDCMDPECMGRPICAPAEDCKNGIDDDGDHLADCKDPDCTNGPD